MWLIAQLQNVEAGHLKDIMLTLVGLVGVAALVMHIVRKPAVRLEPQPVETREAAAYATKPELAEVRNAVNELRRDMRADVASIYGELKAVREKTAEISGEMKHVNISLAAINQKIDRS